MSRKEVAEILAGWTDTPVGDSTLKIKSVCGMWMRTAGHHENRVFQEHEHYHRVMGALLHFYLTA